MPEDIVTTEQSVLKKAIVRLMPKATIMTLLDSPSASFGDASSELSASCGSQT
ncbi:hypothetical protein AA14337_3382 [Acetobacter malorum DSM 14337]|uniref:Uncharacterized protein n=1 Tax=Acetobacter malorum DSM 14337 TaxID=1307910 RepID=A0ABQ0Q194_9PROT|nr:hypothetical protein AA14337_3382 [Acetobacter malorum DSM 14337]